MNIAYRYRLYPNKEQERLFAKTFGCCRKVWNLMLSDKIKHYNQDKTFGVQTPAQYKSEYPFLKEVDSLALVNVQNHLQQAFVSCFSKTRKKNTKFPKFKSKKHSKKSYTTNNQNGTVALAGNFIKLPKVGKVKAVLHRLPESDWALKSATITKERDGSYYVSVLFEYDANVVKVNPTKVLGLDYKSDGLYMDSEGNTGTNHKFYRESQNKLIKEQRRLSRKQNKSKNYNKQLIKVNKIHRKIANQRLDNLHKLSTTIANQYDVVCVETLNMQGISKSFKLGKATYDNGYGMFLNLLKYKLLARGKYFVQVERTYPSTKLCSCCGNKHDMSLKDKTYICKCGNIMDRDLNAAINIKNKGLEILQDLIG